MDRQLSSTQPAAIELQPESAGYFSGFAPDATAGSRYGYRLDGDEFAYPDYASRFQPQGVHLPSEVIDPTHFHWTDEQWRGPSLEGQILYELHIGTFTPQGSWAAASDHLPALADLGVTLLEVMPVADFHGEFGWGYDGVSWYAPTRLYGRPDDFRQFVNRAHRLGMGVILDVVYNHFGPSGNYVGAFSSTFASRHHNTEWGQAINFDGEDCGPVREFVVSNAAYWIAEFHLDGLRIDATHSIHDDSADHILAALTRAARTAASDRHVLIYSESEPQQVQHVAPTATGGFGLDGIWNDDFHHSAHVAATDQKAFYYGDYRGTPQELVSAVKWGFLYQGQWNDRQQRHRGTPAFQVAAPRFVNYLQNHDQVSNSTCGLRLHALTSPGRFRALTALLLLSPGTPMLFMGQEFAATAPFPYFADQDEHAANQVREGRWEFLRQFEQPGDRSQSAALPDPADAATFRMAQLDWADAQRHPEYVNLHRDLITLRRRDPVFSRQDAGMIQGAVLGDDAFVLRWIDAGGEDRLVLVNLGEPPFSPPVAESLLAPPALGCWKLLWSSEDSRYGGGGAPAVDTRHWPLTGQSALVVMAGS